MAIRKIRKYDEYIVYAEHCLKLARFATSRKSRTFGAKWRPNGSSWPICPPLRNSLRNDAVLILAATKKHIGVEGCLPHRLVRTCRSGFHPRREELTGFLLRAGSRLAAVAWRPGPANQMVGADMMHDLFQ